MWWYTVPYIVAVKCESILLFALQKDVYKAPITDPGKNSKKGKLTLEIENGTYVTRQGGTGNPEKVQTLLINWIRNTINDLLFLLNTAQHWLFFF